jgi:hypothetical protein
MTKGEDNESAIHCCLTRWLAERYQRDDYSGSQDNRESERSDKCVHPYQRSLSQRDHGRMTDVLMTMMYS